MWFLRAAMQGNDIAQTYMGIRYSDEGNHTEAFKFFFKAANQGHPTAQIHIALCYLYGRGVEIDMKLFRHWVSLSAKNENPLAQLFLGMTFSFGC